MTSLIQRVSLLEKKLKINESVKSEALRRFFELLKSKNKSRDANSLKVVLRGMPKLSWSELTDLDVLFLTPEKAIEYAKDDTKIVMWGFNRKKEIENGAKGSYFSPWDFVLTRGKKFIFFDFRDEGKFGTEDQIETGYNKYKNYVSYKSLSSHYADFALVINFDAFSKSLASTTDLRKLRKEFREFEFYYRDNIRLAIKNITNYKNKRALIQGEKRTKELTLEVNKILNELKLKIESYSVANFFQEIENSMNSFDSNISRSGHKYSYKTYEFNSKMMELLKNIAEIYNSLSREILFHVDSVVVSYKSGEEPGSYTLRREKVIYELIGKAKILIQKFEKLENFI